MFVDDNPDASVDEILAHYGVLGMKWGKRRMRGDTIDVKAARGRVQMQKAQLDRAHQKAQRINDPVERARAMKDVGNQKVALLKNPDRVLAARLTTGEKIATALFFTPVGAAAIIGTTSAVSRRIERKQEKGKYDK